MLPCTLNAKHHCKNSHNSKCAKHHLTTVQLSFDTLSFHVKFKKTINIHSVALYFRAMPNRGKLLLGKIRIN